MTQAVTHYKARITRGDWDRLSAEYKSTEGAEVLSMLRYTRECGTTLVGVTIVEADCLFDLGEVVATPAVIAALDRATGDAPAIMSRLLARHHRGDWGQLSAEDHGLDDEALASGYRILSVYEVDPVRVWIITEADRSVTTLLLPSEY